MRKIGRPTTIAALALATAILLPLAVAHAAQPGLAEAGDLIERGEAEAALPVLDRWLSDRPSDAEALLLRSTAHFMLGAVAAGQADLDRVLELDPDNRQAWLNAAALDLSEDRLEGALEAFEQAERLDPAAPDNDLNIGTVLALQGDLAAAIGRFDAYLDSQPASAEAHYLVASNLALAGDGAGALARLAQALAQDERLRRRARVDPNLAPLSATPEFERLMATDTYRLPPGAHRAAKTFEIAYDPEHNPLLEAVVRALQLSGRPFDPAVEVTPGWALVWSEFRIKIVPTGPRASQVQLSAPAAAFRTPAEWRSRTRKFFEQVAVQLLTLPPRPRAAGCP